jgi:hypothetical protein
VVTTITFQIPHVGGDSGKALTVAENPDPQLVNHEDFESVFRVLVRKRMVFAIAINDLINVSFLGIDAMVLELIQSPSNVKTGVVQIARYK